MVIIVLPVEVRGESHLLIRGIVNSVVFGGISFFKHIRLIAIAISIFLMGN